MREVTHGMMPEALADTLDVLYADFLLAEQQALSRQHIAEAIKEGVEQLKREPIPEVNFIGRTTAEMLCQALVDWNEVAEVPEPEIIAEIEVALRGLNRIIIEQLRSHFPDRTFIVLGDQINRTNSRVLATDAGMVVKLAVDQNTSINEYGHAKANCLAALRLLYDLPERSPYLAYNIISFDPSEEPREGAQVQRRLPLETFHDMLTVGELPELEVMVRYFREAFLGLQFLLDHHLRLADLSLTNIAVNIETDTALWFDFDGLRREGDVVFGFVGKDEYCPPERFDPGTRLAMPGPITEPEMVYECGACLMVVLTRYANAPSYLQEMAMLMLSDDPQQ